VDRQRKVETGRRRCQIFDFYDEPGWAAEMIRVRSISARSPTPAFQR
jgi:hypothetical protein